MRTNAVSTYAISVPGRRASAISQTHTDPDGHVWHVTVHWADINGRSTPIGVDLHAFTGNDDQVRPTGGVLTAAVVRSLRIAEIAALYHEAKTQGGEPARKPWRYVADRLATQGVPDVTDGQLKNWSRRAKNLGLLDTTRRTRKEKE